MARRPGSPGPRRARIIRRFRRPSDVLTSLLLGILATPGACELVRPPTSAIGAVVVKIAARKVDLVSLWHLVAFGRVHVETRAESHIVHSHAPARRYQSANAREL
jgi:hypothetical protein